MRWLLALPLVAASGAVHAEPTRLRVVGVGLALAPPTYLVGVALHEGSHALAATLVGADVTSFHVFPPGRDPRGIWRFGWTYVHGLETNTERVFFYVAPKLTNAILLGGLATLVLTDAWPTNRYGQVALTTFATGLWVDYAKDVLAFRRTNDIVKAFELTGLTGWKQVPARLLYAATIVGLGAIVHRAYDRTFAEPAPAMTAPLLVHTF